ncbi:methyl-accepting chemotaxis protein [Enterobacillus tribolii]|nr:methyl-accepting chemotaxis protein [Enterobacillus tribolii]MBW7983391.1 HAMP domain-containing protein [Enterobacillus tribolii]
MLSKIRISISVTLLLLLYCALQLLSTGGSFLTQQSDKVSVNNLVNYNAQRESLNQSWAYLLMIRDGINRAVARIAMNAPEEQLNKILGEVRGNLDKSDQAFARFSAIPRVKDEGRRHTEETKVAYAKLSQMMHDAIPYLQRGDLNWLTGAPVQVLQDDFGKQVDEYNQYINKTLNDVLGGSLKQFEFRMIVMGATLVVIVLITLMALYLLHRAVLNPLARLNKHFDSIAQGDLSEPIDTSGSNEIGLVYRNLHTMQQALAATVMNVRKGADSIHQQLQVMASGNDDLSSRTEQQAASLQETSASMEELTSTVKQNADNARQAAELAHDAEVAANDGGEIVSHVVSTMHEISSSSQKIGEITNVIDGIAFQTNILALNAAVEAARAGEQGRGFSVVAGEVRSLAQRSAQAAKEIKGLIDDSVNKVKQGAELVEKAGGAMDGIVNSVGRVNNIMTEITTASDEQSRGIEQVSRAVTQMDQVTQQNAALVGEAAAATLTLEEQANLLNQTVAVFRLSLTQEEYIPMLEEKDIDA